MDPPGSVTSFVENAALQGYWCSSPTAGTPDAARLQIRHVQAVLGRLAKPAAGLERHVDLLIVPVAVDETPGSRMIGIAGTDDEKLAGRLEYLVGKATKLLPQDPRSEGWAESWWWVFRVATVPRPTA